MQSKEALAAPVDVDSRDFVLKFSVQIDGGQRPGGRYLAVGINSNLLVGPPLAGLSAPSSEECVDRLEVQLEARFIALRHATRQRI
ncbi:unnamed protein product [Peronospora farinosa]|uniref:Uncharacterized protein n=1 Tax=Peronospora farinosa TaxID=134698 RepID=A0AAV0UFV3_9STRA|nr:unnamed protein product [Peronospora farinosa]